ncbi:hypothetical protein Lal_00021365 [Lupinus albus]|nr:hypothetical protein Lal_00021365 [Lupinus albus]
MARDLLCIPITTVASESVFRMVDMLLTNYEEEEKEYLKDVYSGSNRKVETLMRRGDDYLFLKL